MIGPGAWLAMVDEDMGELMGKLVGNLVPHPAITNAEHDLRFALGSALVQLHREAVIRLGDQDGFELPLGIVAGNSHGGGVADHLEILRISLEPLLWQSNIQLGHCWRRRIVVGTDKWNGEETKKKERVQGFHHSI